MSEPLPGDQLDPSLFLLYPEKRRIKRSAVIQWAHDEWSNRADWRRCGACGSNTLDEGGCPHDADWTPIYHDPTAKCPVGLDQACRYLEDMGVATFRAMGKPDRSCPNCHGTDLDNNGTTGDRLAWRCRDCGVLTDDDLAIQSDHRDRCGQACRDCGDGTCFECGDLIPEEMT